MNLVPFIYSFLREKGASVNVPDFGVFSLERKHAEFHRETGKILPPKDLISFRRREENTENEDLAEFIANQSAKEISEIKSEIKSEVEKWNQELFKNKKLNLNPLGIIEMGEVETVFTQKEDSFSMEHFGLEEIDLKPIEVENQRDKVLEKSILLGGLVVAPLVAVVYLGVKYQDLIFGKASFENTKRIKESQKLEELRKDSLQLDSLNVRVDSLQNIK